MFKPKKILKSLAVITIAIIAINSSLFLWIKLSGAFDAAASSYRRGVRNAGIDIGLCFLCRKSISYGGNGLIYKFSMDVADISGGGKKIVACKVSRPKNVFEVSFE